MIKNYHMNVISMPLLPICAISVLIFFTGVTNAQDVSGIHWSKFSGAHDFCDEEEALVLYGNGILSPRIDTVVDSGIHELSLAVESDLNAQGKSNTADNIRYGIAFNKSEGAVNDLVQAISDLDNLDMSQLYRWLARGKYYPSKVRDFLLDKAEAWDRTAIEESGVAQLHVENYKRVTNDRKTVLVAHSQGTVISNIVYPNLPTDIGEHFASIFAAAVDDEIRGADRFQPSLPYVSIDEDKFLEYVVGTNIFGFALPRNLDNYDTFLSPHTLVSR